MTHDYALIESGTKLSAANGFVTEDCHRTPLERKTMKAVMTRSKHEPPFRASLVPDGALPQAFRTALQF